MTWLFFPLRRVRVPYARSVCDATLRIKEGRSYACPSFLPPQPSISLQLAFFLSLVCRRPLSLHPHFHPSLPPLWLCVAFYVLARPVTSEVTKNQLETWTGLSLCSFKSVPEGRTDIKHLICPSGLWIGFVVTGRVCALPLRFCAFKKVSMAFFPFPSLCVVAHTNPKALLSRLSSTGPRAGRACSQEKTRAHLAKGDACRDTAVCVQSNAGTCQKKRPTIVWGKKPSNPPTSEKKKYLCTLNYIFRADSTNFSVAFWLLAYFFAFNAVQPSLAFPASCPRSERDFQVHSKRQPNFHSLSLSRSSSFHAKRSGFVRVEVWRERERDASKKGFFSIAFFQGKAGKNKYGSLKVLACRRK